jgi:folate-dependent phosphoribosylglycinamide formyltransferase PurN
MRPWVTFFSQTGSEIYNISKKLHRSPDLIITNKQSLEGVNQNLVHEYGAKIFQISKLPSIEEYKHHIPKRAFVTLHGWLKIVPGEICEQYEIYNLHPANLLLHPHLKGKDPQKRAAAEQLKWSGNTIHRCTSELDGGEIKEYSTVLIECMTESEIIEKLHKDATNLWFTFLNKHLLYST